MSSKIDRIIDNADKLWNQGNNAGRGYEPPDGEEEIADAVESYCADGYALVRSRRGDSVAIVQDGATVLGIGGDAMGRGAWVVDLLAEAARGEVAQ